MKLHFLFIVAVLASVTACAAIVPETVTATIADRGLPYYHSGRRIIRLADNSDLLIYEPLPREEGPPAIDAYMVSARGADEDRNFRLSTWIPEEMAPSTYGQITTAAMSADHKWLAFVGGWAGKRDKRGHNGVFLLQQEPKTRYWRVKSWFDIVGAGIGDIAFGPGETLLLLVQKGRPEGGPAPILAVYSFSGQSLGWFIDTPDHGNWMVQPSSTIDGRIVRLNERSYAIYDPETGQVRFIEVTKAGKDLSVRETRSVPIPFATTRVNLVGFDPRPDGRVVLARSIVEDRRGKTLVTVLDAKGRVAEEWQAPRMWTYGVIGGGLRGYSVVVNKPGVDVTAVTVR